MQEAVPSSQPCSPPRCPAKRRPTVRPHGHPARPQLSRRAHGDPRNPCLAPRATPHTHIPQPALPVLDATPHREGWEGCRRQGLRRTHASMALGAEGGALACSCVTDDWTGRPAKEKHPMECRLEGVVMRSSARIPRVEISRHLLRGCDHGLLCTMWWWWWVCLFWTYQLLSWGAAFHSCTICGYFTMV